MSATQTYNLDNAANFNQVQTAIAAAVAKLALTANTGLSFSADLSAATPGTNIEYSGGSLRQTDPLPTATFAANYDSSINGNFGNGVLTGTATGATVSGGKLVCTGSVKYVDYSGASNSNFAQTGTFKFKLTPNYSGTPASLMYLLVQGNVAGSRNSTAQLFHSSADGNLALFLRDDADNLVSGYSFGLFNPVAGTEYEIKFDYNYTTGATRLFLDGVQLGSTLTATVTRSLPLNFLRLGASFDAAAGSNASFNDFIVFNAVQHTAGYTPGYSVTDTRYLSGTATGLGFTYSQAGGLLALTAFSCTAVDTPKFTVNGKYWNGAAWASSNSTYATASIISDIIANISSLAIASNTVAVVAYFQGQNTPASFSALGFTYTGQKYPASGYIEPIAAGAISAQSISALSVATPATPTNTSIKYGLKVDGTLKYWNGSAWATSDGTEAQLNTLSAVNTNLSSLVLGMNSTIILRIAFFTTDNQATPTLDSATITYDFGGVLDTPATCLITGYYLALDGSGVSGASVEFSLVREAKRYTEASNAIIEKKIVVLTDANGYFESNLIRSSEFEDPTMKYMLSITLEASELETSEISTSTAIEFTVPDATTKDITDILTQVAS